ncbi:hypothetical protein L3Q82_009561, partial [Scortum barcoo]
VVPRSLGGDVLLARLHNPTLGAGVAGQVVDHLNGSYSAVFSLLWEGSAEVEVTLVHPSEAVTVLRRLTSEQPDRIYFHSLFRSGSVSQTTTCNVCLRPTQQPLCNYTDLHTGEPWFCYKPTKLSCDARINHAMPLEDSNKISRMKKKRSSFKGEGWFQHESLHSVVRNYQCHCVTKKGRDAWQSLGGSTVRRFKTSSDISQCLKGKVIHMYGDSTIRQWFEYLNAALPDLKEFDLHSRKQVGPFMALDYANNILVTFRCHGPPIRFGNVPTTELRYIANEIDGINGGTNTVVIFGIWSHFSTFPIEVYVRRLQSIRRAVVRLLDRAPGTLVIIRTANLKALTLYETLTNSDWYSLQRDKVLRAMFQGLNVRLVDAWEMTLAHHLPHNLHPQAPIIKNMFDVILVLRMPSKEWLDVCLEKAVITHGELTYCFCISLESCRVAAS